MGRLELQPVPFHLLCAKFVCQGIVPAETNMFDESSDVPLQCLFKAIDQVKPGVRFRDLGDVISSHAQQEG